MNHDRNTGSMLWIGAPCHFCRREEFLPLKCSGCHYPFCSKHFSQDAHNCPKPHVDVLVPLCPLCDHPPKGWFRGASDEDVKRILESHWALPSVHNGGCLDLLSETDAKSQESKELCHYGLCQKPMFLAVRVRPGLTYSTCLSCLVPTMSRQFLLSTPPAFTTFVSS